MKWRLADAVDEFEPWRRIAGRKAVSLEEYDLGKPLGREGSLPETLVLESAVAFGRWLVVASSGFAESAVLESVDGWRVLGTAGRGARLRVELVAESGTDRPGSLALSARVADEEGTPVASGRLCLQLVPLASLADPESVRLLWSELYQERK